MSSPAPGDVPGRAARFPEYMVRPDVILVHASMPGMRNFGAVRALRRKGVDARIVVIARHSAPEDEFLAIQSGADGYLPSHAGAEELLDVIRCTEPRQLTRQVRLTPHVHTDISEDAGLLE